MATIYQMMGPCKLPGARTTVMWNPARMTKRMRNAVTTLIKTDKFGSWSAGSWQVARTLHRHIDAPFYRHNGFNHVQLRLLKGDTTAVGLIREAMTAQQASARLEGQFPNMRWLEQSITGYYNGKTQELLFYGAVGVCVVLQARLAEHYAFRREQDNQHMLDILNSDQDILVGDFTR